MVEIPSGCFGTYLQLRQKKLFVYSAHIYNTGKNFVTLLHAYVFWKWWSTSAKSADLFSSLKSSPNGYCRGKQRHNYFHYTDIVWCRCLCSCLCIVLSSYISGMLRHFCWILMRYVSHNHIGEWLEYRQIARQDSAGENNELSSHLHLFILAREWQIQVIVQKISNWFVISQVINGDTVLDSDVVYPMNWLVTV